MDLGLQQCRNRACAGAGRRVRHPCVRIVVTPIQISPGAERIHDVARCGQAFKDGVVARLLPPQSATRATVAQEIGIAAVTLARWLKAG